MKRRFHGAGGFFLETDTEKREVEKCSAPNAIPEIQPTPDSAE